MMNNCLQAWSAHVVNLWCFVPKPAVITALETDSKNVCNKLGVSVTGYREEVPLRHTPAKPIRRFLINNNKMFTTSKSTDHSKTRRSRTNFVPFQRKLLHVYDRQ
eukprot:5735287-Amphidinium_carterae.1